MALAVLPKLTNLLNRSMPLPKVFVMVRFYLFVVNCLILMFIYFLFQRGEVNLENVTHEDAVATLKATQERVILVVAKPDSAFSAPPSDTSHSPQLRKYNHLF